MRNGDFSGATFTIKDPRTGLPFPGNIIPASRIDPVATNIVNFFYPLPNQTPLSTGWGIYQKYIPETRNRQRADLRIDHELTSKDSLFARGSYQVRDPRAFRSEVGSGNAFTNLPYLNDKLTTYSVIGGWTRVFSSTVVNEFRMGYNNDTSDRKSNYVAQELAAQLGYEASPSLVEGALGFPAINFVGGTNRPSSLPDAGRNVSRTQYQNSFSISDNLSWVKGEHSLKGGFLWNRNSATDGFGRGLNNRGAYRFDASKTGNAFTDFLLGLPARVDDQVSTRGDLEGTSNDFAVFAQDDWRASPSLTLFLGLRYEITGIFKEKSGLVADFVPLDGGYHIIPNESTRSALPPGLQDPNSMYSSRVYTAAEKGLPETILKTDKNNFSPRVGFAWRVGNTDKTVMRGGFGLFHPTAAVQGLRDQMAANQFRYTIRRTGGGLSNGFSGGTGAPSNDDFGIVGIWPDVQLPDIYQYNLTLEQELPGDMGLRVSYIGSTMRKLLVTNEYNSIPPSTNTIDNGNPDDNVYRPFPLYGYYMTITENTGSGQFNAAQVELQRRFKNGLAFNVAYTYAHSDSNAPDAGNSLDRRHPVRPLQHRGGPRARPQRREAPPGGERDVGHPRGQGSKVRVGHAGLGGCALRGMDALDDRPGAIREQPDPLLHPGLQLDHAVQPRVPPGHDRHLQRRHLAAQPDRGSADRRVPRPLVRPVGLLRARPRGLPRQHQEEQLRGPGHVGGQPGRLQGRHHEGQVQAAVHRHAGQRLQPSAVLGGSQLELHRPDRLPDQRDRQTTAPWVCWARRR